MQKRIISALVTAVMLFTTLAFEFPVSVSAAPGHSPANGHYVYETWCNEGIDVVNYSDSDSYIGYSPYQISDHYYSGSVDSKSYKIVTSGTSPYMAFEANGGSAGVDLSTVNYAVVTFYCKLPDNVPSSYLQLWIDTFSNECAYTDWFSFTSHGEDWVRAIFDLSKLYAYKTNWSKTGNLRYFRLNFGNVSGVEYFIDSVYFTSNLYQAYSYSYDRGYKQGSGTNPDHVSSRIVPVRGYKTIFNTALTTDRNQGIEPYLYSMPADTEETLAATHENVAFRFSRNINYYITDTGYSTKYRFVGWEIQRNIVFLEGGGDSVIGTPECPSTDSGTYLLTADQSLCQDQHIELYITAIFEPLTAVIHWQNWEGTVLEVDEEVPFGTVASYDGPTPTKPSDAQYDYQFAGWTPDPNTNPVTDNSWYTATFTPVLRNYPVQFYNWDGTLLQSLSVPYGTTPVYTGATPTKAGDAQYSYSFAGWNTTVSPVTGEATYTATFTQSTNSYNVNWVNWDGTHLATTNVEYGSDPTPPVVPTRPSTPEYSYTFDSWTPALSPVTGDTTYKAVYKETKNTYTVTWEDGSGNIIKTDTYEYGAVPSYTGETPTKPDDTLYTYTFAGWSPEISAVTGDATYIAVFTSEKRVADLVINVNGTEEIDENQSYIFDILMPGETKLTVAAYGDSSVTVKDVPTGIAVVSERDNWSFRYSNNGVQTVEVTAAPDVTDGDSTNDNTAYFSMERAEVKDGNTGSTALWLSGDSYKKKKYGLPS